MVVVPVLKLADKLGLEIKSYDDEKLYTVADLTLTDHDFVEDQIYIETSTNEIDVKMRKVHDAVMAKMDYKFLGYNDNNRVQDDKYPVYDTPWGLRETTPFHFDFVFDPYEMGENAEHMTLGVALSSRYFPTFIDMEDPNGGIGTVDLHMALAKAEIAKEELVKEFPALLHTDVFSREKHY